MKSDSPTAFLIAIAQSGLLPTEQVAALNQLLIDYPDNPQQVAREIVHRGWLTAFQVREFWKGQGDALVLGPYLLIDKLGEGGMGEVFRAQHRHMGRNVALKIIRPQKLNSPEAIRRFRQETMAAAQLSHPNIVMAYDADADGDRPYFAMEYVEGMTLSQVVQERGPLPVREACEMVRQAALGLQHAHEKGMIHRDIKPSNLLLTARLNVVKILDMGLARLDTTFIGPDESRITQEGILVGTPDYIAPEQARNARNADIRADIYSLGATCYFLLTGQLLFPGGTATEKLVRHATEIPPDPTLVRPDLPKPLLAIMVKMLAKRPEDRFQTPIELARAIEPLTRAASTTPVQVAPAMPVRPTIPVAKDASTENAFRLPEQNADDRVPQKSGTSPLRVPLMIAGGVASVAVLALLGFILLSGNRSSPGPDTKPEARFINDVGMLFVRIEPGTFRMGSPDNEPGRTLYEGLMREVEISQPFYAGISEVTQGQYTRVMEKNPSEVRFLRDAEFWPVENVSWDDAVAFCVKLNEMDKRKQTGYRYRLPTEAEWEYICRAGQSTAFTFGPKLAAGRQASFQGNNDDPLLETRTESDPKGPTKTSRFVANAWGLFDTHGNVWEWCQDGYEEAGYPPGNVKDPTGSTVTVQRILRGGAWNQPASRCRSAARWGQPPQTRNSSIGFRVVYAPELGG